MWRLDAPDDLLELWDVATRREPPVRNAINEPRWRTADDAAPFTGARTASLLALIDCLHEGRPEVSRMVRGIVMRDASSEEFVAFYMGRLLAAQERVLNMLR